MGRSQKNSEFGKGFVYNLILFSKHWTELFKYVKQYKEIRKEHPDLFSEEGAVSLWFSAAADHLYEFKVPPKWRRRKIGKLARELQEKAIKWRMEEMGNLRDAEKFQADLERLAMMIDEELGVIPVKAGWS